jgi:2-dehydropantoate 2-reductase
MRREGKMARAVAPVHIASSSASEKTPNERRYIASGTDIVPVLLPARAAPPNVDESSKRAGTPMRVVVLGAGAVGAYYGGQLARAGHAVTCLARGANLAAIREHGLEIRTPDGSYRSHLTATDRAEELPPADFAILAVKSYSLDSIAPAVQRCAGQETAVVPLLNGVEAAERLERLGVPAGAILGGLTTISAARVAPGVVERRSPFQSVVVGERRGRTGERAGRIAAAFRDAGVDARASDRIEVELWQKFVFLASLAAACGLARSPIGPLRATSLGRRLLQRAIDEAVAVARARGITLPEGETARVLGLIDGLPPGIKPSFLVDLEAGGPTELDVLSGAVSRFADQAGIATPVHDTATAVLARRAG